MKQKDSTTWQLDSIDELRPPTSCAPAARPATRVRRNTVSTVPSAATNRNT